MKKILVVVDMQNDFIDGPLGTSEARAIVDNVCAKIREGEWDWIIRTYDTHEEDYLNTHEGRKLPIIHCVHGERGWIYNDIILDTIKDYVIDRADSNRYCESSSVFKNTFGASTLPSRLYEFIAECGIDNIELTLVGVCTDICVVSNAMLLKAHFPEMKIVVDASCCAGSTPEKHYMALEVMKSCQVDVVNNYMDIVRENAIKMVSAAYGVPEEVWD